MQAWASLVLNSMEGLLHMHTSLTNQLIKYVRNGQKEDKTYYFMEALLV